MKTYRFIFTPEFTDEDMIRLQSPEGLRLHRQRMRSCSQELLKQIRRRIRHGGDEEYTFPPLDFERPDGTRENPLFHTGLHLYNSLKAGYDNTKVWVETSFVGAKILQEGTIGKGGTNPPITPRVANTLVFMGAGYKKVYAREVNIAPRNYFRISRRGRLDLQRAFERIT